ncbi:MAG: BON domain-containing protein [Thermoguttaceae bacterium]|jgi:hypothetical protein
MRRLLIVLSVAVTTGLVSALAWAGNQETAEQIAASLRASGQLGQCKVGVRFCDGTAWLGGKVRDQAQMDHIIKITFQTQAVARVVNEMTVPSAEEGSAGTSGGLSGAMSKIGSSVAALNPLRRTDDDRTNAQPVATSFPASRDAVPTAMMQPVPPPPAAPAGRAVAPAPLPQADAAMMAGNGVPGGPIPMYPPGTMGGPAPMRTDQPSMPATAWPTYSAYPNYAAVTYPKQYSPTAWPYIGPFYPYPQVPLGWRKVSLQWDDGWWFLQFHDKPCCVWWR